MTRRMYACISPPSPTPLQPPPPPRAASLLPAPLVNPPYHPTPALRPRVAYPTTHFTNPFQAPTDSALQHVTRLPVVGGVWLQERPSCSLSLFLAFSSVFSFSLPSLCFLFLSLLSLFSLSLSPLSLFSLSLSPLSLFSFSLPSLSVFSFSLLSLFSALLSVFSSLSAFFSLGLSVSGVCFLLFLSLLSVSLLSLPCQYVFCFAYPIHLLSSVSVCLSVCLMCLPLLTPLSLFSLSVRLPMTYFCLSTHLLSSFSVCLPVMCLSLHIPLCLPACHVSVSPTPSSLFACLSRECLPYTFLSVCLPVTCLPLHTSLSVCLPVACLPYTPPSLFACLSRVSPSHLPLCLPACRVSPPTHLPASLFACPSVSLTPPSLPRLHFV